MKEQQNNNQSIVNDLSSSLLRNIAKTNNLEVAITKNKANLEGVRSDVSEVQVLLEENKRHLQRLNTIAFSIVFIIITITVLLFINGMLVHYDTGLDESQNRIITDEILN